MLLLLLDWDWEFCWYKINEENVLSAIEKNMLSLGFSDHSYTGCDISYCTDHASYSEYLKTKQRFFSREAFRIFF